VRSWSWRHITPAIVAAAVNAPSLVLRLYTDELHTLHNAAISLRDPSRVMYPWLGGQVLRIPPKLVVMGGLAAWGPRSWAFHLLVLLLHAGCSVLVGRLSERLSGSRAVGLISGVLFATGLGAYGKAVFRASNITMLLALLLLLFSVELLLRRRWLPSVTLLLLAIASHEIALGGLLVLPVVALSGAGHLCAHGSERGGGGERWIRRGLFVALAALCLGALLPFGAHRLFRLELELGWFMLVPLNAGDAVGAAARVRDLEAFLMTLRPWLGGALALGLAVLAARGRRFLLIAVAWVYAFLAPAAVFMVGWSDGWIERRYIYVASVGVCMLAAALTARTARRSRPLGVALLTLLLGWTLVLVGITWRKNMSDSLDPVQVRQRQDYFEELGRSNPRWSDIVERELARG